MVKIIDIMKKLNPDEVDCLKKEFQEKNKIISELEYKLSEKFKNCYWCEKSDELIRLQEKYEYLEGWHDAVLEESSEYESKIADLEAKLAEKNAEVQSWKDGTMVVKLGKLEEQLAEKSKEIEKLKELNQCLVHLRNEEAEELDELINQLEDKEKEVEELKKEIRDELVDNNMAILELQQSQNQKAITELEKVKRDIINLVVWDLTYEDVLGVIDQQITKLKGEG